MGWMLCVYVYGLLWKCARIHSNKMGSRPPQARVSSRCGPPWIDRERETD